MNIITYGTFDYFHYGHYCLLKRAKALGDKLFVGVSTDRMCEAKGKAPLLDQGTRCSVISDLSFVDTVFLEDNMHQKVDDVKKYNIDIFVLGSDYRNIFPNMPEYQKLIDLGCQIVFLERTPGISSSSIKDTLYKQAKFDSLDNTLHEFTNQENQ